MPGGKNNSGNHMDLMMDKPTVDAVTADGSIIHVLVDGVFQENEPSEKAAEVQEEKLPISGFYKVIGYTTIYKTDLWWEAVVVFEAYGKRQMGLYLWQKRGGEWKRKNKFGIRNLDEWSKLKTAVDKLAPQTVGK
jgi:hypothetical protein